MSTDVSTAGGYLLRNVDRLRSLARRYPVCSASASLLLFLSPWLYRNYRAFIALGPGGIPNNVAGWMVALALKACETDTLSTEMYDQDLNKDRWLDCTQIGRAHV